MAFVIADRVRETTTTTGTGAVTLSGAYVSFQSFASAVGNGNSTYYTISSAASGEWEVGIGTYTSSSNTLSRTTVLASSNSGSLVNFTTGSKDVFVTQPAERSLLVQSAGSGLFSGVAAFTANGVPYADSTSTITTGSALTFDGTNFVNTAGYLGTTQSGATSSYYIAKNSAASSGVVFGAHSSGAGYIDVINNNPLFFAVNDTEQMRLTSTGLGIGTPAPVVKFQVKDGTNYNFWVRQNASAIQLAAATDANALTVPMAFSAGSYSWAVNNGTNALNLDSSGNLGLGVTPSAWISVYRAFQFGTGGGLAGRSDNAGIELSSNAYRNSAGNYIYLNTDNAASYRQYAGAHTWFTAPSGTAGNAITFTQAMTLDASGNLGVGQTSPAARLDVLPATDGNTVAKIFAKGTGTARLIYMGREDNAVQGSIFYDGSDGGIGFKTITAHPLKFGTSDTERARIDASGNLGLGVTPSAWVSAAFQTVNQAALIGYANSTFLGQNWLYASGPTSKYLVNGYALVYEQNKVTGAHAWYNSPSGTAGDPISFTQAMTLDASGRLGIGATSPDATLVLDNATASQLSLKYGGSLLGWLYAGSAGFYLASTNFTGFSVAGNEKMRLDSSGNLGLGVTPSAWAGSWRGFQIGGSSGHGGSVYTNAGGTTGQIGVGQNWYYNGSGNYYINSAAASDYYQYAGSHVWRTAASGTAGAALTFTQAMTLDASGRLGIGTTSPGADLSIGDTSTTASRQIRLHGPASGTAGGASVNVVNGTNTIFAIGNASNIVGGAYSSDGMVFWGNANLLFSGNGTERARIDSSGNLLVGTTNSSSSPANGFTVTGGAAVTVVGIGHVTGSGSGTYYEVYNYNGSAIGSVTQSGTTGVLFNITSDHRLKDVVGAVTGSGERIDALKPVNYTWKADGSAARGFLAHEFQEVYANSVTGTKDAVDEEGNPIYQQMQASTTEVIADLVAELQSVRKRLAAAGIA